MQNYTIFQLLLLGLRKLYLSVTKPKLSLLECELDSNKANDLIFNALMDDKPCMITRFGAVEISALNNYVGIVNDKHNVWKFIKGETPEWWWNEGIRFAMKNNAGFFPTTDQNLLKFGSLMLNCIKSIDILGSWQPYEHIFLKYFSTAKLVHIFLLDPFWSKLPWTRALEGKKVLVIHPFAELIKNQYYERRENLFQNKKILPQFDLRVIPAVQSVGGNSEYTDWFQALEYMKEQVDKQDYHICLIGAGAYGLPLAAYIKNKGKKAVHIGGPLQLLFGIWGKRWNNPHYASNILNFEGAYLSMKNSYWVEPSEKLRPVNYQDIEGGCYW